MSERSRGRLPIPLNSKRLTAGHLKRLARALEVPTTAAGDEIWQMVEGKLTEPGREPQNVQVMLSSGTPKAVFSLQDEEGEFLTITEEGEEEPPEPVTSEPRREGEKMETLPAELEAVRVENTELQQQLDREKTRFRELWRTNCRCLAEYDDMLMQKDLEIARLKPLLTEAGHESLSKASHRSESPVGGSDPVSDTGRHEGGLALPTESKPRRGKAPLVDPFTGEEPEIRLDDWLPSLKRAATWNEWTEGKLLQFTGHLRGCALQEWSLLDEASKETFPVAV